MNQNFAVFVNSTDSYSDCWEPLFKLFKKFWGDYQGKIYLNTEEKDYSYPGLTIIPTKVAKFKDKNLLTWSECLLYAFDQIEEDVILYIQEDYFLKDHVNHEKMSELVDLVLKHQITYLNISDSGNHGPFKPSVINENIWEVDQNDKYRISTQASLWNVKKMRGYVRKHENPWHFEYYGNIRARRRKDLFYAVNRENYNRHKNPIFPYDATGIVARKWMKEVVLDLFQENNIEMDFEKRGFYDPAKDAKRFVKKPLFERTVSTIKSLI
jgi:hypothetical protein